MWEHSPTHLRFGFILAVQCEQPLLFQGRHFVQLLLCEKEKTLKPAALAYGYCHEIGATMKLPDQQSGNEARGFFGSEHFDRRQKQKGDFQDKRRKQELFRRQTTVFSIFKQALCPVFTVVQISEVCNSLFQQILIPERRHRGAPPEMLFTFLQLV